MGSALPSRPRPSLQGLNTSTRSDVTQSPCGKRFSSLHPSSARKWKFALHKLECRVVGAKSPFELRIFDGIENLAEHRSGRVACSNQVVAGDQRHRANLFWRNLRKLLLDKHIRAQIAVTGQAVGAVQCEMFVEAGHAQEFFQRRLVHTCGMTEAHVIVDQSKHLSSI